MRARFAVQGQRHFNDAAICPWHKLAFAHIQRLGQANDQGLVIVTDGTDVATGDPDFSPGFGVDDLDFTPRTCAQNPGVGVGKSEGRIERESSAANEVERRRHQRR